MANHPSPVPGFFAAIQEKQRNFLPKIGHRHKPTSRPSLLDLWPARDSGILRDCPNKPHFRSDWEERFSHWKKPISDSEEQKAEATKKRVERALEKSDFLREYRAQLIYQGSSYNNTNVRLESDLDVCVCLQRIHCFGGDHLTATSMQAQYPLVPFTFQDFRNNVKSALVTEFGQSAVTDGKKSLQINKENRTLTSVDVVPAYTYVFYPPHVSNPQNSLTVGVSLTSLDGTTHTSFPRLHYINGCQKNNRTNHFFKETVRILKWLRNHIANNASVPEHIRSKVSNTSSFLIENLVYNCPDHIFLESTTYKRVVSVLTFIHCNLLGESPLLRTAFPLMEANQVKELFSPDKPSNATDAQYAIKAFMDYMEI